MGADVLVWMDLEMTGLDPEKERILEAAVLVTDGELNVLEEGPNVVIHQPESLLDAMDDWNKRHHGRSGLLDLVRQSTVSEAEAETQLLEFVTRMTSGAKAPLAGNSIHHDRRFIARYMPRLDGALHYRLVDVSSVKELVKRWCPAIHSGRPNKKEAHRAVDDIHESLAELRYYRERAFRIDPPTPT
jgi:oligoribonuclease